MSTPGERPLEREPREKSESHETSASFAPIREIRDPRAFMVCPASRAPSLDLRLVHPLHRPHPCVNKTGREVYKHIPTKAQSLSHLAGDYPMLPNEH